MGSEGLPGSGGGTCQLAKWAGNRPPWYKKPRGSEKDIKSEWGEGVKVRRASLRR